MARIPIWEIPPEYVIEYSPIGDDIDSFSQKVKYCLEEAFYNLRTLHEGYKKIAGLIPVEIENLRDGQILVYRESLEAFCNEDISALSQSIGALSQDVTHLMRLIENLYLALDVAQLDPGGYDGVNVETFYGNSDNVDETRSYGLTTQGKILGDDATIVTKPIVFVNEVTGVERSVSKAHLVVKHQNIADIAIMAEIAFRPTATFVKGEVIGIGTGSEQTVMLAHTEDLSDYKFAVYFDGVAQKGMFVNYEYGEVTFTAPEGTIVSADYFHNFGDESFIEMEKTGTYPDRYNPNRATTEFVYEGETSGKVATLRLTFGLETGSAENEIVATGTGEAQGFRLSHQAIANSIQVLPSTATWKYNAELNTIIVTAPKGSEINISYSWRGKSFSVDSFAVMFNE